MENTQALPLETSVPITVTGVTVLHHLLLGGQPQDAPSWVRVM